MSEPESEAGKETITTYELLVRNARAGLELQREDGSFPAGSNSIYNEEVTPVRKTSHWLRTLISAYEITGDDVFSNAADAASDYLLSKNARPHGYTFHIRNTERKDKCNGVIGQSAPIKALVEAGNVLSRSELIEVAHEVFSLLPFDENLALWERREIDGSKLSIDRTLNHQINIASAGSFLSGYSETAEHRVRFFLDNLEAIIGTRETGIIRHYVRPSISTSIKETMKNHDLIFLWNEIVYHYHTHNTSMENKEMGYHSIILRDLGVLKNKFPYHEFWECDIVDGSINAALEHTDKILQKDYGGPMGGIHLALGLRELNNCKVEWMSLVENNLRENISKNNKQVFVLNQLAPLFILKYLPECEIIYPEESIE